MNIVLWGASASLSLWISKWSRQRVKHYTPTHFYCHKYQYWKEIRVILGGTMKDLLRLEKIIVDVAITLLFLLFLFLIILRRSPTLKVRSEFRE